MKISIVTVVYNNNEGIRKTIKSVINQTYQDTQFVVIDGGSTDGTVDVCEEYRSSIDVFISETDKGIYDAMNKGLNLCNGDYVIFMNSSDTFANENTLSEVACKCVSKPDFVFGDAYEKELNGDNILLEKRARNYKWKWFGMFAHHQSIFYKTSILFDNSIKYNLCYKLSSDWDFTLRFLKVATHKLYIPSPICIFERGGYSANYMLGLKEQLQIRRRELNYARLLSYAIYLFQFCLIQGRLIAPGLYNFLRFKKNR